MKDGNWYSNSFMPELNHVAVGDKVKITYKVNGQYKNHETIEVLEKAAVQSAGQVSRGNSRDPVTMILSYVKDMSVSNGKSLKENVVDMLRAYNVIKIAINDDAAMAQIIAEPKEVPTERPGEI